MKIWYIVKKVILHISLTFAILNDTTKCKPSSVKFSECSIQKINIFTVTTVNELRTFNRFGHIIIDNMGHIPTKIEKNFYSKRIRTEVIKIFQELE